MVTTVRIIGTDLPEQADTYREAFARMVKAAFNNGADRVELLDGSRSLGWISAAGCAHYQPIIEPVLPFTGDPFDG